MGVVLNRTERRKARNREALIEAGRQVLSEKGIDAATMVEIAQIADVGSGTVYNYFGSKDELVIAVLERVMRRLAEQIQAVTVTFADPDRVYAFGVRSVMQATIEDHRWRALLNRSEVLAEAMFRVMGPYAMRDLKAATERGHYHLADVELVWRMATHAIVGFGLSATTSEANDGMLENAVVALLGMAGVDPDAARRIAQSDWPVLPPE